MTAATWVALVALIVGAFGCIARMVIRDVCEPRDLPIYVAHKPHPAAKRMYQPRWPVIYTHAAPGRPLTLEQAHEDMQQHRDCDPESCPRRQAALTTLIDAGHITPDSHRIRS